MRVCLSMASGKTVWSEAIGDENAEPPAHINVPMAIPGKGFGQIVLDFFGVMHTPNENSYLLYVQRVSEATH